MTPRHLVFGILLTALTFSNGKQAAAAGGTFLNLELGLPLMTMALDATLQPNLGAPIFVGAEVSRTLSDLPMALGLFSRAMLGGKFGTLSVLQTGVSAYYFPFSKLESVLDIDNEVIVKTSGVVPYIKAQGGLQYLDLRDPGDTGVKFGASSLMYVLAAGIHIPLSTDFRFGLESGYSTSVNASDPNGAPIALSGMLFSGHVVFLLR